MSTLTDLFGEPIHTYSRADAIADGVLVDVTDTAREAGFKIPVALTRAVFEDCVSWQDVPEFKPPQDERGRLWDVLSLAAWSAKAAGKIGRDRGRFSVWRVPIGGRGIKPQPVNLVVQVGPGDHAEPVITIMQPQED